LGALGLIYAKFTSQFGNPNATPETVREYATAIRPPVWRTRLCRATPASFVRSSSPCVGRCGQGSPRLEVHWTRAGPTVQNPAKILGLAPPSVNSR